MQSAKQTAHYTHSSVSADQTYSLSKTPVTTQGPASDISKWRAMGAFLKNGTCSKTLMVLMNQHFNHPLSIEENAAHPLAGGLMRGYQCGMIWGSALAAGAVAYRTHGPGAEAEVAAIRAASKLSKTFRRCNQYENCADITEIDPRNGWQVFMHFFVKGGTVKCMRRAAMYAPKAAEDIFETVTTSSVSPKCNPLSCASCTARRMGASELHATMVAGLAGGIGLRGGACGALGAAIWMNGVKGHKAGLSNKAINAENETLIERFLKASEYEFECTEIVGGSFAKIDEHASYLKDGGCEKIINAITA